MSKTANQSNSPEKDPLALLEQLEEAMENVALQAFERSERPVDQAPRQAALDVAVALGWCRLFNVELEGDLDVVLPSNIAVVAAQELTSRAQQWVTDSQKLGEKWDAADEQLEKDDILASALTDRMDAWAAIVAINEAVMSSIVGSEPGSTALRHAADYAAGAVQAFDDVLYEERSLLSAILDTNLIENWRGILSRNSKIDLPWWLDGTLEAEAEIAQREAYSMMPDAEAWARMHERFDVPDEAIRMASNEDWLPVARPLLMAAAGAQDREPLLKTILHWQRKDGKYQAMLGIDEWYLQDSPVIVSFLNVENDELATELAGQAVQLAGVSGIIDATGYAQFEHARLYANKEIGPVLVVDGEPWVAVDE